MLAFLLAHQAFLVSILVGLFSAGFNWVCKPRTEEQYQKYSPRVAGFFRLMAALFPDPHSVLQAMWQLWMNSHELPPIPNPNASSEKKP